MPTTFKYNAYPPTSATPFSPLLPNYLPIKISTKNFTNYQALIPIFPYFLMMLYSIAQLMILYYIYKILYKNPCSFVTFFSYPILSFILMKNDNKNVYCKLINILFTKFLQHFCIL